MSNHEHWAFEMGKTSIAAFFHNLHLRFAQRCNRQRSGVGPVYADRPKNFAVQESRLLPLVSYIHMNPVRAGVVNRAADSLWSSHNYYMRKKPAPPWLDIESNLYALGFEDTTAGRRQFDEAIHEVGSISTEEQTHFDTFAIGQAGTLDITSKNDKKPCLESISNYVQVLYGLEDHQLADRYRNDKYRCARLVFTKIALAEGFSLAAIATHLNRSRSTIHGISRSTLSTQQNKVVGEYRRILKTSQALDHFREANMLIKVRKCKEISILEAVI